MLRRSQQQQAGRQNQRRKEEIKEEDRRPEKSTDMSAARNHQKRSLDRNRMSRKGTTPHRDEGTQNGFCMPDKEGEKREGERDTETNP
jgi:hypothetical protein